MKKQEMKLNESTLLIETGHVARQSSGSVIVTHGETSVLVAVNAAKQAREDARKEREEARLAKEREREAVREAGTQAFPITRKSGGDARRARFERAKAERQSRRGSGADLRERLRGSRGRSRGAAGERGAAQVDRGEGATTAARSARGDDSRPGG